MHRTVCVCCRVRTCVSVCVCVCVCVHVLLSNHWSNVGHVTLALLAYWPLVDVDDMYQPIECGEAFIRKLNLIYFWCHSLVRSGKPAVKWYIVRIQSVCVLLNRGCVVQLCVYPVSNCFFFINLALGQQQIRITANAMIIYCEKLILFCYYVNLRTFAVYHVIYASIYFMVRWRISRWFVPQVVIMCWF